MATRRIDSLLHFIVAVIIVNPVLPSLAGETEAPVGQEQLDGSRVKITERHCSVAAPGANWTWMKDKDDPYNGYACKNNESGDVLRIQFCSGQTCSKEVVRKMCDGIREGFAEASKAQQLKLKLHHLKIDQVNFPPHGKLFRATYDFKMTDAESNRVSCYFLQVGDSVAVCVGQGAIKEESEALKDFVSSVRLEK